VDGRLAGTCRIGNYPLRHALSGHQRHDGLTGLTGQLHSPAQRIGYIRGPRLEAEGDVDLAVPGHIEEMADCLQIAASGVGHAADALVQQLRFVVIERNQHLGVLRYLLYISHLLGLLFEMVASYIRRRDQDRHRAKGFRRPQPLGGTHLLLACPCLSCPCLYRPAGRPWGCP